MAGKKFTFPHSSPMPPEAVGGETGVKATQEEVNYRSAGASETNCSNCAFYQGDGFCEVVAGHIDPGGVSDLYQPREEQLTDLVA